MSKLAVLWLAGAFCVCAFAEDARLPPRGVLRIDQSYSYSFINASFDENGDARPIESGYGRIRLINIGAAAEYGATDRIAIGARWTPGWNVWSDYDYTVLPFDRVRFTGPFDVYAGVRVLAALGPAARFAFGAGAKIPLPSPDWAQERQRCEAGEPWRIQAADKHTPGVGGRGSLDLLPGGPFRLTLYGECMRYFLKPYREVNLSTWNQQTYEEVDYGYDLTLAAEPRFEIALGAGLRLEVGAPVTWLVTPEVKLDGEPQEGTDTYLLTVRPCLSLSLTRTPVPLEIELGYTWPLRGKYLDAAHTVTLQVSSFLGPSK
jgi:hypothetical protein